MKDARKNARATDPETSKAAAASIRTGSHKQLLLEAYRAAGYKGLTDEEAAERAGLTRTGYWKRCSDLRRDGFIVPRTYDDGDIMTRIVMSGQWAMVCVYAGGLDD